MTNRTFDLHMAPPVVLEVKHGQKNARGLPTKLEGMIVVTREKGRGGDAVANFTHAKDVMDALPKDEAEGLIKKIPIRLISDDFMESFHVYRGFYGKGKLACGSNYGDTKAMRMFRGSEWVEPYEVDCGPDCPYWNKEKEPCDLGGTLYFNLGLMLPRNNDLVLYRINGRHAQRRMLASLEILHGRTGGIMAGLPLQIAFYSDLVKDGTNKTRSVPIIVVEPQDGTILEEELALELTRRRAVSEALVAVGVKQATDSIYRKGMLKSIQRREIVTSMEEYADSEDNFIADPDGSEHEAMAAVKEVREKFPWIKMGLISIIVNKFTKADGVDTEGMFKYIEQTYPKKEG